MHKKAGHQSGFDPHASEFYAGASLLANKLAGSACAKRFASKLAPTKS